MATKKMEFKSVEIRVFFSEAYAEEAVEVDTMTLLTNQKKYGFFRYVDVLTLEDWYKRTTELTQGEYFLNYCLKINGLPYRYTRKAMEVRDFFSSSK